MTFGEFKTLVRGNIIGELALPSDDEVLKSLLDFIIKSDIASTVVPTSLLEQDTSKAEMLYSFPKSDKFYIRKPVQVVDDNSQIDLDEELCVAAVYFMAEKFIKDAPELNKKAEMRQKGFSVLSDYMWAFADYLESKGICDDLSR